jgi:hypothetical protein
MLALREQGPVLARAARLRRSPSQPHRFSGSRSRHAESVQFVAVEIAEIGDVEGEQRVIEFPGARHVVGAERYVPDHSLFSLAGFEARQLCLAMASNGAARRADRDARGEQPLGLQSAPVGPRAMLRARSDQGAPRRTSAAMTTTSPEGPKRAVVLLYKLKPMKVLSCPRN